MGERTKRLLVPVRGTDGDERAIRAAVKMAAKYPSTVTLVYVVEVLQSLPLDAELPAEIDRGESILNHAETIARGLLDQKQSTVTTELLQARSAGAAIVDESVERGVDTIILAGRLRTKHGKPVLGDTVGYILKTAPCEVVLMRQPLSREADASGDARAAALAGVGGA